MPKVALSTCWLSPRHTDGYDMLCEVADLGFEWAELSHGVRMSLVPGILKAVEEKVIGISSLHNFCPLPAGINHAAPNLYQPTSKDGRELHMWLRQTQKTIDFASEVGASHIVLHGGSVKVLWEGAIKKVFSYRKGRSAQELAADMHYKILVEKAMGKVRKQVPDAMNRLIHSLAQVLPICQERGIKLGLENRDGLKEMPLDGDFQLVFDALGNSENIGYWHDSGHAKVKEQIGLLHHAPHMSRYAEQCVGFHLKDCNEKGRENLPLGEGCIDFDMLATHFREDHVITLEVGPNLEVEEIESSRDYLFDLVG